MAGIARPQARALIHAARFCVASVQVRADVSGVQNSGLFNLGGGEGQKPNTQNTRAWALPE